MRVHGHAPLLEEILGHWRTSLGADYHAYRYHGYRVLNFCLAFGDASAEAFDKVSIAAAFHDLGIWTHHTFDYLAPSQTLARDYLIRTRRDTWTDEVEAMIAFHHKLARYTGRADLLVEPFRKADWIDVSRGRFRFGLPPSFVRDNLAAFPNAGFHQRLAIFTLKRLATHPFSPLPMMRL
jgi:hypothetical protein